MMTQSVSMNKSIWLNNMAYPLTGNPGLRFREMVSALSVKEIVALRRNSDLLKRLQDVASMSKRCLLSEIQTHFGFKIDMCQNGDMWIENEASDNLRPEWTTKGRTLPHCGWYLSYDSADNSFEPWACQFLTQDVRTVLWERYLEKKVEDAKSGKPQSYSGGEPGFLTSVGMYL